MGLILTSVKASGQQSEFRQQWNPEVLPPQEMVCTIQRQPWGLNLGTVAKSQQRQQRSGIPTTNCPLSFLAGATTPQMSPSSQWNSDLRSTDLRYSREGPQVPHALSEQITRINVVPYAWAKWKHKHENCKTILQSEGRGEATCEREEILSNRRTFLPISCYMA